MTRRVLLGGVAASGLSTLAACAGSPRTGSRRSAVALTIDDFALEDTPRLTAAARHDALLNTLARRRIKAAGFPTGKFVDNAAGRTALTSWSDAGHLIGNHTYAHPYFSGKDPSGLMADIDKAERLLDNYAGFRKLFRFPYLAEGRTAEGRDTMRRLLAASGYRNAHVTIDLSDWYISNRLVERLTARPEADTTPYRDYYLGHVWERATYYDRLSRALLGGEGVQHTLLLHHNLLNGLCLDDVLAMFTRRGWGLVDAEAAFAQPLFARSPISLPAGQSLIWALAREAGRHEAELRFPAEDGEYERPAMDALKL